MRAPKTMPNPKLIALWSAPRSRSTAFFRMMVERGDFMAVHEPFSTRAEHGQVEIEGAVARTEPDVLAALRRLAAERPVFFKDTTDERYASVIRDEAFLARDAVHTFIIRHPAETIPSYYALNSRVRREQIGMETLHELFVRVWALTGKTPVVVDADDLVAQPARTVERYCAAVGIPYLAEALAWQAGKRAEWAATDRWHVEASQTTQFEKRAPRHGVRLEEHEHLAAYLEHHLPFYAALHAERLRV